MNLSLASGALLLALLRQSNAKCPVSGTGEGSEGCPHSGADAKIRSSIATNNLVRFKKPPRVRSSQRALAEAETDFVYSNQRVGDGGIPEGGYAAVREDIEAALTDSQEFWPADFNEPDGPSYGGLFIRLAWHCNGSYRTSDGRGGCDGGSILHDPVKSWPDNASLDMAIKLLQPIKDKYGEKLSWGDLIVLAGDVSIQTMGGPVLGFCGGRRDDANGDESIPLGPSELQHSLMPCGDEQCPVGELCPGCEFPLGASRMSIVYVDPEGPEGQKGNVTAAAASMREVFGRMGFDDRHTVAVTGGGHAFGKAHGACMSTEGPGFCPSGNTWEDKLTSGLEVVWTTAPTTWTNQYFNNIFNYNWTKVTGPGGAEQWKPADEGAPPIGMLTTDLALSQGDPEYEKLSRAYAADLDLITKDFGEAWYQLMARDVGPRSRCMGDELPAEMQYWETSLYFGPLSSTSDIDYIKVRSAVQESIDADQGSLSAFANLAMMCASTFRHTDYSGGCNGAAIRFSPQIDWASSAGASDALAKLEPIKKLFPDVSYADIIVLAGQTAIEAVGGKPMPFCGGRADAEDGAKSELLEPRLWNNDEYASFLYNTNNKGLSLMEGVALLATPKDGSTTLSNQFFVDLDPSSIYLQDDIGSIVEEFVADNDKFLTEYAKAFTYMVTADLFGGPSANACQGVDIPTVTVGGIEVDATETDATETDSTETGGDAAETDGDTADTPESKAIRHLGNVCVSAAAIASIFALFFV